ncbi:MAG: orotate phosphoribosyltransferase [Deltaproteobacteria bacterium]
MNSSKEFAKNLLQIKAIKINLQNLFVWASGIHSPIYCDNRVVLSYPVIREQVIDSLIELVAGYEDIDFIAGVATAGIPWGAILADRLKKPFIYVRSEAKSHGRQNQIEGELPTGNNVLIVEDLISTGGSSIKAVEAVRANNCIVTGVISLFDYKLKDAKNNFNSISCDYKSICDFDILIAEALDLNYIDKKEYNIIKEWKSDPENWFKNLINIK